MKWKAKKILLFRGRKIRQKKTHQKNKIRINQRLYVKFFNFLPQHIVLIQFDFFFLHFFLHPYRTWNKAHLGEIIKNNKNWQQNAINRNYERENII